MLRNHFTETSFAMSIIYTFTFLKKIVAISAKKLKYKYKIVLTVKKNRFVKHLQDKMACREAKQKDRETFTTFLVFDLQNVLSCPHAEQSKLNVYNLTAFLSSTKQVYCSLWHEGLMARTGNDLASNLIKMLECVFSDNPDLTTLVLW